MQESKAFCRICGGMCGVVATVDDDGRLVSVRGDKSHALTQGYACIKGVQAPASHNHPDRILRPLKRMPDGSFQPIGIEQALDEIGEKMRAILKRHGPEALAGYRGTFNATNSSTQSMLAALLKAIGSHGYYTSLTVDQSAKPLTLDRLGGWSAGRQPFATSDVSIFFGNNPLVSVYGGNGFPALHPEKRLREAKDRGQKIIVVDPRLTETASFADVFLQPYPGEDPTIAAGLLRIILTEGWHDREFCERYVEGLDGLAEAVAPFTPEYVERRAGVPAAKLREAAAMFARDSKRGIAGTGTGTDMAPRSNLAEHLVECLNVVCGRYPREGERIVNPGVLNPRRDAYAEVVPPTRSFERGHKSRTGHGMIMGEMMSCILADEILTPGEGQVRSLLVVGGAPVDALPDQKKVVRALRSLELLVAIDPFMNNTTRLCHYILPPTMMYEQVGLTPPHFEKRFVPVPFAQLSPAIARPPAGAEVADDSYYLWALAKRLGVQLEMNGTPLDMVDAPSTEDILNVLLKGGAVTIDELKNYPNGKLFEVEPQYVLPARPGADARFVVAPSDIREELAEVAAEPVAPQQWEYEGVVYTHRLAVRRVREVMNSMYRDLPAVRRRMPVNPASIHPDDLARLGVEDGGMIELVSDNGRIPARAKADPTVRSGVVTLTHGFGGLPDEEGNYAEQGSSVNLLVSSERHLEKINAMARLSAIPVQIVPAPHLDAARAGEQAASPALA
jgi:anaerobic selenocysteine-containing dehydrogenase